MKYFLIPMFLLIASHSAECARPSFSLPLKGFENTPLGEEYVTNKGGVAMVSRPEIVVHLPDAETATGLALIVCPGGSYREVGLFADGMRTVPFFTPKGVAVIVLKYRTRPPSRNVVNDALEDARQAVRLVRYHAKEWKIDPERIGMIGSSAGSHLVLNLATHFDNGNSDATDAIGRENCRPNFIALLCPWPNKQTIADFPVTSESPPAFIACAKDDTVAPITFSESIVNAWKGASVPVKFWPLEKGGHRAFKQIKNPAYQWMERLTEWLEKERL
ncbi:MAG: alpha/beta hydrolase [Chthoniobacterales bacterium]